MTLTLLRYLAAHKLKLAIVGTSMLASTGVEMLTPWPLKFVVDQIVGHQPLFGYSLDALSSTFLVLLAALAYILLAGARGLLALGRERLLVQVTQDASVALRSDLYAQLQRLSLRYHDRTRVGDVVARLTGDVDELHEAFINVLSSFSVDVLAVVGIAVMMFAIDWRFALVSLAIVPPLIGIFTAFRQRVRDVSRAVRTGEGAMSAMAQEALSSIRVVKAFGQEDREHQRFIDQTRLTAEANIRRVTWQGVLFFLVEIASAIGVALVLAYGGLRVVEGTLTLGEMLVFMQYLTALYSPLRRLSRMATTIQWAAASAERIGELFQQAPEVAEATHAVSLPRARGDIAFDGVWFGYDLQRPVLRGIQLVITAGEVLAVVGQTGAGKSTLASLIPRFYDPTQGRVLVDGKDVRSVRLRSLREQISLVLQDTLLLSGTIRDNIAYGRPEASDAAVMAAAEAAYADEFIASLPDGYDSHVGERGVTLSGGQRQRIAIARAILMDSPILILDEPTSAVDVASERFILEALRQLIRGRTVVIITHRSSLVQLAGRVAVLAHGQIVETGTLAEVQASGQVYGQLYGRGTVTNSRAAASRGTGSLA